jgi:hypothetical protein
MTTAPTPRDSRISATSSAARITSSGLTIGHFVRGAGRNSANRVAIPKAALTRSSTVIRRTRAISAVREAAWLTLGRSFGNEGESLMLPS